MADGGNGGDEQPEQEMVKALVDEMMQQVVARTDNQMKELGESVMKLAQMTAALAQSRNLPAHSSLAVQAMSHLIQSGKTYTPEALSKKAYDIADAMEAEGSVRAEVRRRVAEQFAIQVKNDEGMEERIQAAIERGNAEREGTLPISEDRS